MFLFITQSIMHFSINKEYPSRFLRGDEVVAHAPMELAIKDIKKEQYHSRKTNKKEQTLVVYFKDKERGVALGKQRAQDLVAACGSDNTEDWLGQVVTLYIEKKDAFGKILNVIRFKPFK